MDNKVKYNQKHFKNNPKNVNAIIDLERLKGEKINNISQYNNAMQRQVIQNQQKLQILKYHNETQIQSNISKIKEIKRLDCDCD